MLGSRDYWVCLMRSLARKQCDVRNALCNNRFFEHQSMQLRPGGFNHRLRLKNAEGNDRLESSLK
jgi:hypothetical protein